MQQARRTFGRRVEWGVCICHVPAAVARIYVVHTHTAGKWCVCDASEHRDNEYGVMLLRIFSRFVQGSLRCVHTLHVILFIMD